MTQSDESVGAIAQIREEYEEALEKANEDPESETGFYEGGKAIGLRRALKILGEWDGDSDD